MTKIIKYYSVNVDNPNQPDRLISYTNTAGVYSLALLKRLKKYEELGYVKNISIINLI